MNSPFPVYFITLFPDEMSAYFHKGLLGKAVANGLISPLFVDLRSFALDVHSKVDDYPFGGKKGMLLKADVIYRAVTSIDHYPDYRLLYACPKGSQLSQEDVTLSSKVKGLVFICGYYEGVDERIFDLLPIHRFSLGDFVLSSGELPSLVYFEAVSRYIPGVLGNAECLEDDSIVNGLLEYPQFTSPRVLDSGHSVPEVILSGHHGHIREWRHRQSLSETLFQRPELLWNYEMNERDLIVVVDILKEDTQCQY
jgi:tRNA (guanine37-N1)-methyltransferase